MASSISASSTPSGGTFISRPFHVGVANSGRVASSNSNSSAFDGSRASAAMSMEGGASGSTIPNSAGSASTNGGKFANYKMFENSWGHAYPNEALRWMHKPSRDGASPDFYSSTLGRLDVHYSSGVANHFFFLLAHGSQIDALSENEQSPMTNGVTSITGIGNDKAARIWYKALTAYFTSGTTYAGARTATLSAATALYGASSTEYATVNKAWLAVNVK